MAGQIIKRGDKTWIVRIFMGRDEQGKRRYTNKTIRGTKKDADKYLATTLTAISTGAFVEPSALTVNEYLDKWLQSAARPRLRLRTATDYEELLKRYVRPALGGKKLTDVRPLDMQTLYTKMQERELSTRTVRYTHAVLSSALKQAVKWGLLARNPATQVELPRLIRKEMHALSPEEAARFLAAAADDAYGIIFAFALVTGCRPGEYLGLKWQDVDLERGVVTVQRSLVWDSGDNWYFDEPKTARSRRQVPLSSSLLRALVEHRRRQAEARLKAEAEYQNDDLVFASPEGRPLMRRNLIRRHFKPTLKRAGLPKTLRLYDLRHSCATLLLSANEHPKIVADRLGHTTITLTMDTYSHVLPSMQQAASDKLENILFIKRGTL